MAEEARETVHPDPRSARSGSSGELVPLAVDPRLRSRLSNLARGRVLVLGYFTSRSCCVTIGDLTARLRTAAPADHVELEPVDGVRVFLAPTLAGLFRDAGPRLRLAGPPFASHVAVDLDRPEYWIDVLDGRRALSP
jgi:hypothetical protein